MEERYSEGKKTWVSIGLSILTVVLAALAALLESDLIPKEHLAYIIIAGIVAAAGTTGLVHRDRTQKKVAEALAKANPTSPPSP